MNSYCPGTEPDVESCLDRVDVYKVIMSAPSVVSIKHMPAVKSRGKSRISQIEVPRAAWMLLIPRSAISDDVSKPRPNSTPKGYIFQGRSISLNMRWKRWNKQPPPCNEKPPA